MKKKELKKQMSEKLEVCLKVEGKWAKRDLKKKTIISKTTIPKLLISKIVRYVVQSYFEIRYDIRQPNSISKFDSKFDIDSNLTEFQYVRKFWFDTHVLTAYNRLYYSIDSVGAA
jgi:hypothetical protein